jgi:hypothetical protein
MKCSERGALQSFYQYHVACTVVKRVSASVVFTGNTWSDQLFECMLPAVVSSGNTLSRKHVA